ncbi:MAG: undecaprenyl-diphosphate phosphatase [Coriobacteriaceae bacterium]|nr:undecaprenyl-diphosphate phosphatase [Coriobacteriaceae bacterium]
MLIEALKSLIIGIVEGITEWLPISSTGHMILVDEFIHLDVSEEFLDLFLVVIQIGAILAVIILYFRKLNPFSFHKTREEKRGTWRLWGLVVIGCIPALIFGVLLDDWMEEHFYNAYVVAAALIVYGIVFILIEHRNRKRFKQFKAAAAKPGKHSLPSADGSLEVSPDEMFKIRTVDDIDWKTALKIGCFQVLAIIPGTSRSGSTIIGGMLVGCSRTAAAEFTFFLAIPVMLGWGLLRAIRYVAQIGLTMTSTEVVVLVVGIVSAFIVAVFAIRFLMGYIKKNDFTAFGVYRIIVGVVVLVYFGIRALL